MPALGNAITGTISTSNENVNDVSRAHKHNTEYKLAIISSKDPTIYHRGLNHLKESRTKNAIPHAKDPRIRRSHQRCTKKGEEWSEQCPTNDISTIYIPHINHSAKRLVHKSRAGEDREKKPQQRRAKKQEEIWYNRDCQRLVTQEVRNRELVEIQQAKRDSTPTNVQCTTSRGIDKTCPGTPAVAGSRNIGDVVFACHI